MKEPVSVTHGGVLITLDESTNVWSFELRGRSRSSESLAKAREAIDRAVDLKDPKEKPFQKRKAYIWSFHKTPNIVDVTSVAEPSAYSRTPCFWVIESGSRSKQDAASLFEIDEPTKAIVEKHRKLSIERDKLDQEIRSLRAGMTPFKEEITQ